MGIKRALARWLAPNCEQAPEIAVGMSSAGVLKVDVSSFRKSKAVKRQISALRNQEI